MPALSIIVPVYDVEAYLADCLDSVLAQDFADFEVIAINDASPDRSLEILKRYERADPRVKVIDLERNGGLGAARNRGLDVAAGTYVLFLDSDDSIVPGALSAMVDRASQTGADVVLFDWTREFPDGTVLPGAAREVLAKAPERFTAADYPKILHVLQIACNKLIRRDLLERIGLRFFDGWYEDTPFTYPLLVSAGSITTLPLALLRYRQRPQGITRSTGARHLEVLGQWDRAMARVYELAPDNPTVKSHLFAQMLRHCTTVLLKHERVPRSLHGPFLRQLRELYRRYRPPEGYRAMGRLDRLQHSLLQLGSPALLRAHTKVTSYIRRHVHHPREDA